MTKHLAGLDHLRALAICMVMLFHYRHFDHPGWIDGFGKFGFTGVDLFFVLSGYLIASGLLVSVDWRSFVVKRVFRILPAYYFVLAVYFLWPTFHERDGIAPLWRFVTFTQNFGLDLGQGATFSHAWSLCVEEHFYLVLPIVLLLAKGRLKALAYALPALVALGMVTRWLSWEGSEWITWYKTIYYPTYQRLDGLIAGVTLAAIMTFNPRAKRFIEARSYVFSLAAAALLPLAWWVTQDSKSLFASIVEFPLIAAGYGCLVAAALSWKRRWIVTETIATLSFSTYLVHKGVYHVVQLFADDSASSMTFCVCIAASFAVSAVIYIAIEKPMLAFGRRLKTA